MKIIETLHSLRETITIDLASTEEKQTKPSDPDYTVMLKGGMIYEQNIPKIFVTDLKKFREKAVKRNRIIIDYVTENNVPIHVENFAAYKDSYEILKDVLMGIRSIFPLTLPGSKEAKADPLRPLFEAGNIYFVKAPWNTDAYEECAVFPNGIHDDIVDCMAMLYHVFKRKPKSRSRNVIY